MAQNAEAQIIGVCWFPGKGNIKKKQNDEVPQPKTSKVMMAHSQCKTPVPARPAQTLSAEKGSPQLSRAWAY